MARQGLWPRGVWDQSQGRSTNVSPVSPHFPHFSPFPSFFLFCQKEVSGSMGWGGVSHRGRMRAKDRRGPHPPGAWPWNAGPVRSGTGRPGLSLGYRQLCTGAERAYCQPHPPLGTALTCTHPYPHPYPHPLSLCPLRGSHRKREKRPQQPGSCRCVRGVSRGRTWVVALAERR